MQNAGFLFAAFTIIWAVLFIYVLVLINRQKALRREIQTMKEAYKPKEAD